VTAGKVIPKKESVARRKFRKWLKTRDYFLLTPALFALIAIVSLFLVWFSVPEVRMGSTFSTPVAMEKADLTFNAFSGVMSGDGAKYGSPAIPNPALPFYFGIMIFVLLFSIGAFLLDGVGLVAVNLFVLPILGLSYYPMLFAGLENFFVGGLYRYTDGKFGGTIYGGLGFYLFGIGLTGGIFVSIAAVILRVYRARKQANLISLAGN
jgi:hypothetical protein